MLFSWFDGPSLVILVAAIAAVGSAGLRGRRREPARHGARRACGRCCSVGSRSSTPACTKKDDRCCGSSGSRRHVTATTTTSDGTPSRASPSTATSRIPMCASRRLGHRQHGWHGPLPLLRRSPMTATSCAAGSRTCRITSGPTRTSSSSVWAAAPTCCRPSSSSSDRSPAPRSTATSSTSLTGSWATSRATSIVIRRVEIVNDEARSYLARTDGRYDIIQISLIDTWAATGAGAFALTENSLYTTEAWELFFDRLQPEGVLAVTRFYDTRDDGGRPVDPVETWRTVALAVGGSDRRGVPEPRDHLAIYRSPDGLRRRPGDRHRQRGPAVGGRPGRARSASARASGSAPVLTDDS